MEWDYDGALFSKVAEALDALRLFALAPGYALEVECMSETGEVQGTGIYTVQELEPGFGGAESRAFGFPLCFSDSYYQWWSERVFKVEGGVVHSLRQRFGSVPPVRPVTLLFHAKVDRLQFMKIRVFRPILEIGNCFFLLIF